MTAITSGARKNRCASFSSRNAPGSFSSAPQTWARTLPNAARLALEQQEAPGHELLVIGHA
jgi:hypothetical protein